MQPPLLRARLLRANTLEPAVAWLRSELPMSGLLYAKIGDLLTELLHQEALKGILIEEIGASGEVRRLSGLGLSLFISDAWLQGYVSAPTPFFFMDILKRTLAGEGGVLDRRQIAAANASSGLNLAVNYMQDGWNLSDPYWRAVGTLGHQTYVTHHRGYQLKAAIQEDWSKNVEMYASAGYQAVATMPITDIALVAPPLADQRILLFAERADLLKRAPGSTCAYVFEHHRPRLSLSIAEQRLLSRAIEGVTDQEIATQLDVSPTTLKHTWRRIYERVYLAAPFLIDDESADGRRGPEKRRRLLAYLLDHPEELRPYAQALAPSVASGR